MQTECYSILFLNMYAKKFTMYNDPCVADVLRHSLDRCKAFDLLAVVIRCHPEVVDTSLSDVILNLESVDTVDRGHAVQMRFVRDFAMQERDFYVRWWVTTENGAFQRSRLVFFEEDDSSVVSSSGNILCHRLGGAVGGRKDYLVGRRCMETIIKVNQQ